MDIVSSFTSHCIKHMTAFILLLFHEFCKKNFHSQVGNAHSTCNFVFQSNELCYNSASHELYILRENIQCCCDYTELLWWWLTKLYICTIQPEQGPGRAIVGCQDCPAPAYELESRDAQYSLHKKSLIGSAIRSVHDSTRAILRKPRICFYDKRRW